jgi:hypothetical protein
VYRVLVGKPKGKRLLGRPRGKWEDTISMDLQEVECESMVWIELAQDRDSWRALPFTCQITPTYYSQYLTLSLPN